MESFLSYLDVNSGDQTQVTRLAKQTFYLLSHVTSWFFIAETIYTISTVWEHIGFICICHGAYNCTYSATKFVF